MTVDTAEMLLATLLRMEVWNQELASHPDRVLVETILQGIKEGFRVGFDPGRAALKEKDGNMASVSERTGVISKYLEDELRLPKNKLARLLEELSHWRGRKACKKRDLLSLIGLLAHASKVVRAARTFLRRLIDLSMAVTQLEHFVRLNHEARFDIEWWYQFSSKWNGITILQERSNNKMVSLTSDASGSWGCGAYWDTKWFMFKWSGPVAECHITTKELVPIVMATALWGEEWRGQIVQVWCDNAAVVSIVNHGSTRDKQAMHLTRCLAFTMTKLELQLEAALQ